MRSHARLVEPENFLKESTATHTVEGGSSVARFIFHYKIFIYCTAKRLNVLVAHKMIEWRAWLISQYELKVAFKTFKKSFNWHRNPFRKDAASPRDGNQSVRFVGPNCVGGGGTGTHPNERDAKVSLHKPIFGALAVHF